MVIIKKIIIPTGWSPKSTSKQVYELLSSEIGWIDRDGNVFNFIMNDKPQRVSLLAQNISTGEVAAGILKSIANKSTSMLARGEVIDEVAFTGGLAKSKELV
ncbi:putative (R)-2-hydroxyglutaryl-CoA dehydratase alpha-subunit [Clostridioides difficile DA00165]|nr:putative (R)-2-hydroxyglutaryl-CoA dehydratase alpha-subunit [Clostridioides difficile DA00165]